MLYLLYFVSGIWCFGDTLKHDLLLFCWFPEKAAVVIVFEESTLKSANIYLLESKFNTQTLTARQAATVDIYTQWYTGNVWHSDSNRIYVINQRINPSYGY